MNRIAFSFLMLFLFTHQFCFSQRKMNLNSIENKSFSSKSIYSPQNDDQLRKLKKKGIVLNDNSFSICPESIESQYETSLVVCRTGNNCSAGMNYLKGELVLDPEFNDRSFDFAWSTKRNNLTGVCWQVVRNAFNCDNLELPENMVAQGISTEKYKQIDKLQGTFTIDFAAFSSTPLAPINFELKNKRKFNKASNVGLASSMSASQLQTAFPQIYYIRIIPMVENQLVFGSSNVIKLTFAKLNAQGQIAYVPPVVYDFPAIYSLKFSSFDPIIFPTMKWGTVYIAGFDENLYKEACKNKVSKQYNEQLRQTYEQKMKNLQPIVPDSYSGEGSDGWLESLWDAANSAVNWVSSGYEWAKQQLIDIAAELVDELPLVDCNEDCKALLKTGLEAGMMALGVPPSLPNAEQLMNEGMDYLAAEISSQVGCGVPCEDIIREKLQQLGEEVTQQQINALANEEMAHRHGVEPMQFPNWVKVRLAPESGIQIPKLTLELKRNHLDIENLPNVDLNRYLIRVSFHCINKAYKEGKKIIVPVNTVYKDGFAVSYDYDKLKLPETPTAMLWSSRLIPVPAIEKGDKLSIPINLLDLTYLFPGHLDLIRQNKGHIFQDDWSKMYMNGQLTIVIELLGKEMEAGTFNDVYKVLAIETKEIDLPNEFNGNYQLPVQIQ